MGFNVSPAVTVKEIDLTGIVPAVSTTVAGYAGPFAWGPLNELVLIPNEADLVRRYGKPDDLTAESFFSAANFLAYSNAIQVTRVARESGNSALNSTSEATTGSNTTGTGLLVKNDTHYDGSYSTGQGDVGEWIAKYPGALGNSLRVSRCDSSNAYSSTLTGTIDVTSNTTAVAGSATVFEVEIGIGDMIVLSGAEFEVTAIASNTALTIGTTFKKTTISAGASVERRWAYYSSTDRAPGTSQFVTDRSGADDEIHVVVVDEDGAITGVPKTVIEVFEGASKASDAKRDDGTSNHYKNVVNDLSNYVRWMDYPLTLNYGTAATGTNFNVPVLPDYRSLAAGADGGPASGTGTEADVIAVADAERGYDLLAETDNVDVSLIIQGKARGDNALVTTLSNYIIENVVNTRKDAVAFLSPDRADVVNNSGSEITAVTAFRNDLTASSYAVLDSGYKYQYDKYNDVFRWVPLNGDVAGTCALTDQERDPWYSPAGFNRGTIKNVVKLAYNPAVVADRDSLFKNDINPVVTFQGQGTKLFGDRTLIGKPSAFDAINVRRLFIVLEKAIATASKFLLFEFNDEFTRAQFKNLVEPFLRDVQGRRGIADFAVIADETNNTAEVIGRNEFVGTIIVDPARAIRNITLNFVATRSGVEFTEITGQF